MSREYPLMLIKVPGTVEFQDCRGDTNIVYSDDEYDDAKKDGWHDSVAEAKAAHEKTLEPPADDTKKETAKEKKAREAKEAQELKELEERIDLIDAALAVGIEVQEEWTNDQIKEEIAKKEAK